MGFWEHIAELRSRFLRSVAFIATVAILSFAFQLRRIWVAGFRLYYPWPDPFNNMCSQILQRLRTDLVPADVAVVVTTPAEAILVEIKISLFIGVALGMPFVLYQIWKFASPAMHKHEKRMALGLIFPATGLFLLGCAFSYFLITPFTIDFLYGYARALNVGLLLSVDEFVSFILLFTLAFGLAFELPVVMYLISKTGLVGPDFWKKYWKHSMVAFAVFGAAITPDASGVTMLMVMLPMIALYGVGYLLSVRINRQKEAV